MKVFTKEGNKPIKAWVDGVPVEDAAMKQLENIASMPFIYKHVAVLPDVHLGRGATVGSVIPTKGAIIPAAVGVDLGCGMMAVKLSCPADDFFKSPATIRNALEKAIPHGRTNKGGKGDRGAWGDPPKEVYAQWGNLAAGFKKITDKHPTIEKSNNINHLGTLGGGNHFVEACLDENDSVWIMLHSGSRGVGNRIGSYFINLAKRDMEKYFIDLPDVDLAYLPEGTQHFEDYIEAMLWAQDFAKRNRDVMMTRALDALAKLGFDATPLNVIDCHHNHTERENHYGSNVWITRKGAVRARVKDYAVIPGSMGAKSFIVKGKGHKDSFTSCSHGAGRKMSRTQAKKQFSVEDHIKATEGIECRKDEGVVDETPMAYKDIDLVMAAQEELVEVVHTLRQKVCVKG